MKDGGKDKEKDQGKEKKANKEKEEEKLTKEEKKLKKKGEENKAKEARVNFRKLPVRKGFKWKLKLLEETYIKAGIGKLKTKEDEEEDDEEEIS